MKVTIESIGIGAFGTGNYRIIKGPGRFGGWRPSGDHPNNSIIGNGQNTEKSPGDLRRLAVTQFPVKDHQMSLMWEILIKMKMSIRLDTTGWARWSTGNWTRNWNLTILPNGICTSQNPSWRMRHYFLFFSAWVKGSAWLALFALRALVYSPSTWGSFSWTRWLE